MDEERPVAASRKLEWWGRGQQIPVNVQEEKAEFHDISSEEAGRVGYRNSSIQPIFKVSLNWSEEPPWHSLAARYSSHTDRTPK